MNTAAFGHREKGDSFCLKNQRLEIGSSLPFEFFYISRSVNFKKYFMWGISFTWAICGGQANSSNPKPECDGKYKEEFLKKQMVQPRTRTIPEYSRCSNYILPTVYFINGCCQDFRVNAFAPQKIPLFTKRLQRKSLALIVLTKILLAKHQQNTKLHRQFPSS